MKAPLPVCTIILSFVISLPIMLAAQSDAVDKEIAGVISGQIYDAETKQPLSAVNVFVDSLLVGTATANNGKFVLSYLQPGAYRLVASRIGYETYEEAVIVLPGKLVARQIALRPTEVTGEEVTVTAARREQTAQMAPASVVILNARDLRVRSVTTFDQALEMVPGVAVFRTSGVSVQSLSIRGSSDVAGGGVGNRVLLMIDGRPALTPDTGGALWSLVPTNFIDHIEVVKGAFSSLYGSNAMGGVINVITRRPSYRAMTSVDLGYGFYDRAHAGLRYTNKLPLQNQLELSHSGNRGRVSYLLNLSRKESDGHSENTAYEFYNVFGKMLYDFRQNRNLELSLGTVIADNDYPHTWLNNLQPFRVAPEYRDDRQQKRVHSADLLYWAVPSARAKYSSRFYFYRNASRSYFNQPFDLQTNVDADKWGNLTQFDYYLNSRHYLIAGLDVQIDHVTSSPDTVMYGDRRVNNAAVYLQDEINLAPPLTATVGWRYDWNHLVAGKTLQQSSPKLGLVYRPYEALAMRLLVGQAFRAPSIAERFFQYELGGGTHFKPNPDLKAERIGFSLETGTRWRLGDFVDVDLAYFRHHYRDMIYWVEISAEEGVVYTLFQVRNLKRAIIQGLDAGVNFHWQRRLHASLNYTYLDAKDRSSDRDNDRLAYRNRHSLFFSTDANAGRFTLSVHGQYRSKLDEVFLYPRDIPQGYFVVNTKATMRLNDLYQLSLAVNNIFDTQYEELERYRMPGRNWILGARVQF